MASLVRMPYGAILAAGAAFVALSAAGDVAADANGAICRAYTRWKQQVQTH